MSYNGTDMVIAAERHFRNAEQLLKNADAVGKSEIWKQTTAQLSLAESQAGLLAMELAKWSVNPDGLQLP